MYNPSVSRFQQILGHFARKIEASYTVSMIKEDIIIINKLGLHARAAAKLVSAASAFSCTVELEKYGHAVDAQSIISVLMLAAGQGTQVTLKTDGEEELAAAEAVKQLINNRFDEAE